MAPDHPWVTEHPDFFVAGTEEQLAASPQNYCRVETGQGTRVLAYGRDPYFDGWPDTLQLNYGNPALQEAMLGELDADRRPVRRRPLRHGDAGPAGGLREDLGNRRACVLAPSQRQAVRAEVPGFLFLAEVYWDLEWTLQQQGFDYTYDKRLYDRLVEGHARPVREHLSAGLDFQDHLARFLENHDEPRAAATFTPEAHRAAAVITFLTPGLRFFHQGQREGKRVRIPVHLGRGPVEASEAGIAAFYDGLLECLKDPAFRDGDWQLLECRPAWDGNGTWDSFVAFAWTGPDDARRLVAVNYAAHQSQCYVTMPWRDLDGRTWRLQDLMGPAVYDREGADLARQGLYLDMPAWGYHVFALSTRGDNKDHNYEDPMYKS